MADLKPTPSVYQSSRELFDVLFGEDTALPLIEAASAGDDTSLQSLLSQQQYQKIAFEEPHCIYSQDRPSKHESPVRGVLAMPFLNLKRVLVHAAKNGHAGAVSVLLGFASQQQDTDPSSIITYWAVWHAIENGHAAVIEAMAAWDPARIVNFHLGHSGPFPLDLAVRRGKVGVAAVLLRLGSDPSAKLSPSRSRGYRNSLLCRSAHSANPRMVQLLLEDGVAVAQSGALQAASEFGRLDTMRLLIQHGADTNEILENDSLPRVNRSLLATWTPLHFAACRGNTEAMKLLESHGAHHDTIDENGMTPGQLLEAYKLGDVADTTVTGILRRKK